jgi:glycosyltransferase involved in cell wall biosynthesis
VLGELRRHPRVKLVDRGRADVWLASGHDPPPGREPLVVQVHEAGWADPELRAFLDSTFADGIEANTRAAVELAARVITPSAAARDQVIEVFGLPGERVHAVPHGVAHELFRPGLAGAARLVGDAPYVLFVGVLHPRKNLAAVREAVRDLAASGLPHVLAVVGNPAADTRAERFEREARSELDGQPGRVIVLRDLRDGELAALMAGAAVFCLPSFYEGFGLPVLEAMACGAPVVVSDRGALPEVVGDAGLVVEPTPAAVSAAVRRVVSEPELAARMRERSVARAAGFDWARTAAGWLEVLTLAA